VVELVEYAQYRGIRVVPELDVPGHARGLLPLEKAGLQFCEPADATRSQLYDDPTNHTFGVLTKLMTELAGLFPDPVFNVGSDETGVKGRCPLANTKNLESKVLDYVKNTLHKQPMAWVNALTTTKAAIPGTILDTWATVYGMPDVVTAAGYPCVASTYMYLNHVDGAAGSYSNYWRDIAPGVTPINKQRFMLGGEISMWTDDYSYTHQCGASSGPTPIAATMYGPQEDSTFAASLAGVMFPRTSVGAASLWNYQPELDPNSTVFVAHMRAQNARMIQRGLDTCPNDCVCEILTRCGTAYPNASLVEYTLL
jgi:hexosaminidase